MNSQTRSAIREAAEDSIDPRLLVLTISPEYRPGFANALSLYHQSEGIKRYNIERKKATKVIIPTTCINEGFKLAFGDEQFDYGFYKKAIKAWEKAQKSYVVK